MNTKKGYNKPAIEVIRIDLDDNIMVNSPYSQDLDGGRTTSGGGNARERTFWDD